MKTLSSNKNGKSIWRKIKWMWYFRYGIGAKMQRKSTFNEIIELS